MAPKKNKQTADETKQFRGHHTFVNKDASNIETKDHYATVSWHVMNRYEKWRKQEQATKSKGSTPASSSQKPPTSSIVGRGPAPTFSGSNPFQSPTQPDSQSISHYPPAPWCLENVQQSVLSQRFNDCVIYDPQLASIFPAAIANTDYMIDEGVSGWDEIYGNGDQIPPLISRILHFMHEVVVPDLWPQETDTTRWLYEISKSADDVSDMYGDILFASASLCLYATLLASFTHEEGLASEACFWQMQAMNELSSRIQHHAGNHSLFTMRAMLKLFSADTVLGNTSTARIHLKMLRSIVQSQGGVIMLESWFRENLLGADAYFALVCGTRPLFSINEWCPGPLSQPWRDNLAITQMLGHHTNVIGAAVEHTQLRTLMVDLRELFRVKMYLETNALPVDNPLLRWYQLRKYDCTNRLADHQLNVKLYPHAYKKPKLHAAICTAMALMMTMVLGSPEPIRIGKKLTQELETKLNETNIIAVGNTPFANTGASTNCLDVQHVVFWMLYVGGLAESVYMRTSTSPNFQITFEQMAVSLALHTKEERQPIFGRFLFSTDLEAEISSGRPCRVDDTIKGLYEACGTSWRQPFQTTPDYIPT